MIKKFLARLGKGAATVDLKLDKEEYRTGEAIQGEIIIQGGEVEQNINHLAVRFMMSAGLKQGPVTQQITIIPIISKDIIHPEEVKALPFHYKIPADIPLSSGSVSYFFDTHLDIDGGFDRKDKDEVAIKPEQRIMAILNALDTLGFREKTSSGKLDAYGQEFAFFPTDHFKGAVNEIELRFAAEQQGIRIWLEVDIKTPYKEVEAKCELFIDEKALQQEEQIAEIVEQHITKLMERPYMYSHPFSFEPTLHQGGHPSGIKQAIPGMIGGLAVGVMGGMLMNELLDDLEMDDFMEDVAEEFEDSMEEFEDLTDGFDDFVGSDDY